MILQFIVYCIREIIVVWENNFYNKKYWFLWLLVVLWICNWRVVLKCIVVFLRLFLLWIFVYFLLDLYFQSIVSLLFWFSTPFLRSERFSPFTQFLDVCIFVWLFVRLGNLWWRDFELGKFTGLESIKEIWNSLCPDLVKLFVIDLWQRVCIRVKGEFLQL